VLAGGICTLIGLLCELCGHLVLERELRRAAAAGITLDGLKPELDQPSPEDPVDAALPGCASAVEQWLENVGEDRRREHVPLLSARRAWDAEGRLIAEVREGAALFLADNLDVIRAVEALALCGPTGAAVVREELCGMELSTRRGQRPSMRFVLLKSLAVAALVAADSGESERACSLLEALFSLSRQFYGGGSFYGALQSASADRLAVHALRRAFPVCSFDDKQLRRLQESLSQRLPHYDRAEVIRASLRERWSAVLKVQEEYRRAAWRDWEFWAMVYCLTPGWSKLDAAAVLHQCVEEAEWAALPPGHAIEWYRERQAAAPFSRSVLPVSSVAVPWSTVALFEKLATTEAAYRVAEAALALARYELARGEYPDSLDALVPEFIQSLPADPFGSGLVRYERQRECAKIWSVACELPSQDHAEPGEGAKGGEDDDVVFTLRALRPAVHR